MEEPPMSPLASPPPSSHDGFRFDQEDLAHWIEELDVDSLTEDFMSIEELEELWESFGPDVRMFLLREEEIGNHSSHEEDVPEDLPATPSRSSTA